MLVSRPSLLCLVCFSKVNTFLGGDLQECPKNPIFQEHLKKIEEAVRTNLEEGVDLIQGRLETSPRDWVFHTFCAHSTP